MRYLRKKDYLDQDGEIVNNPSADALFNDHQSLSQATVCSITGKIAFGPNAGKYVTRIGKGFGYGEEIPRAKGKRCYSINGFSLHANTAINTLQRDRLKKLIEYIARGPLSNERLEITKDQKVKLRLKTAYSDGTSHLLFSFGEFIEKLVALIPPPRSHLVRWAGVLAPNSPYRKDITLKPQIKKGFQFQDENDKESQVLKRKNNSWSKMLAKVFKIDVSKCTECNGEMRAICSVIEPSSVQRYLKHINMDYEPPARAPPKLSQEYQNIDQSFHFDEQEPEDLNK